jgi:hypothetical protein
MVLKMMFTKGKNILSDKGGSYGKRKEKRFSEKGGDGDCCYGDGSGWCALCACPR